MKVQPTSERRATPHRVRLCTAKWLPLDASSHLWSTYTQLQKTLRGVRRHRSNCGMRWSSTNVVQWGGTPGSLCNVLEMYGMVHLTKTLCPVYSCIHCQNHITEAYNLCSTVRFRRVIYLFSVWVPVWDHLEAGLEMTACGLTWSWESARAVPTLTQWATSPDPYTF